MAKPIDKSILICPNCRSAKLLFSANIILCQKCREQFTCRDDNKYYFIKPPQSNFSFIERLKEYLKKIPQLYTLLIYIISPVCPTDYFKQKELLKNELAQNNDALIINLGSGSSNLSTNVSNVDFFPYANVDMTCDITSLPIKNNSVDMILNIAVLEHTQEPEKIVAEMYRTLKPGGTLYCIFPFMQGFHAAPYDFSRRSEAGLQLLFKNFETIELACAGGPTSGFLWIFQEWLAILLSFGIVPIYNLIHLLTMILFWPIKFLDLVLIKHPKAKNISSSFMFIGTKPKHKNTTSIK